MVNLKAQARESGADSIAQDGRVAVIHLGEPVGGARLALQKALGSSAQVGHSQVRVALRKGWQEVLAKTLQGMASFRAQGMDLSSAG